MLRKGIFFCFFLLLYQCSSTAGISFFDLTKEEEEALESALSVIRTSSAVPIEDAVEGDEKLNAPFLVENNLTAFHLPIFDPDENANIRQNNGFLTFSLGSTSSGILNQDIVLAISVTNINDNNPPSSYVFENENGTSFNRSIDSRQISHIVLDTQGSPIPVLQKQNTVTDIDYYVISLRRSSQYFINIFSQSINDTDHPVALMTFVAVDSP